MKSIIKIFTMLGAVMLFSACLRNEFNVEVSIDDREAHTYLVRYYAAAKAGGRFVEAAIPVASGKGEFKGITRNPTIVFLYDRSDRPALIFYVERGDKIVLKGKSGNPSEWDVSGNEVNEEWSKWRRSHQSDLIRGDDESTNRAVGAYVKEHPDTELATLLMLTTYNRRLDEDGYLKLWNMIPEKRKTPAILIAAGRSDQPTADATPLGALPTLALHAFRDTMVTINPADSRVSLLWFRRSDGGMDAAATIDSLRKLYQNYGDSTKLRIVEISFDYDTITWGRQVMSDSTRWLHAIMPAAEATPEAMEMQVGSTPFFIVSDSKGKQLYRGNNLAKALDAGRKLLK